MPHSLSRVVLIVLGAVATLMACSRPLDPKAYTDAYDPRRHPYIIGVGDRLSVHVWKDSELSTETVVRPDGTITVPLIGEVAAHGRTASDVREQISERVGKYVKDAIVTVAVSEVTSYHFTVTGEVAHPGVFGPGRYVSVAEAVTLAGGPTRYAEADKVVVIRRDAADPPPRRIPIDYDGILKGEHPEQDIAILRGDTIYVP